MSSLLSTDDKGLKSLHCLLVYVEEAHKIDGLSSKKKLEKGSQFINVVEWITLVESAETCISTWKLDRVRRYVFFGALVKLIVSTLVSGHVSMCSLPI